MYGLGAISGPVLVGPLIDLLGEQALFIVSAVGSALLAALAICRRVY